MKQHLTASAVSLGARNEERARESVANRAPTAFNKNTRTEAAASRANLVLVSSRTHTLLLSGELDYRSAHALEAEIERLCEEGVTGITLDLRELTYIDSIGVAVILFRCGLCKRRGYDFALVPGPQFVHRAFEAAGVAQLLPFREDEVTAPRLPALVLGRRSREGCEQ
jgi:stage II sporulation protein AA (anti-sigma F factor antagonist)